jgi:hypothetical protein
MAILCWAAKNSLRGTPRFKYVRLKYVLWSGDKYTYIVVVKSMYDLYIYPRGEAGQVIRVRKKRVIVTDYGSLSVLRAIESRPCLSTLVFP